MELLFQIRTDQAGRRGLYPFDSDAKALIDKHHDDEVVALGRARRLRNPRQHKMYWALVAEMSSYADVKCSREDVSDWLKIAVGHCEEIVYPDGTKAVRPKSIAFGNLSQESWEAFFDSVLDFVCARIIPGTKSADLRAHLEEMIG